MPFTRPIDGYTVIYSSNTFPPRIGLKLGTQFVGQCVFHPNGIQLPPDLQRPNGQVDLQYHLDDFQNVLDLLRNEKPIQLTFNGVGPGFENFVGTGAEAVGEGDKP